MTSHNQTLIDLVHLLFNLASRFHSLRLSFAVSFLQLRDKYNDFSPAVQEWLRFVPNFLPSLIRFLQCLRRYRDEKCPFAVSLTPRECYPHLSNGIKYFMSMVAMCFFRSNACYGVFQLLYTFYALNWDLREDWGGRRGKE